MDNREANNNPHSPYCTCKGCCNLRLNQHNNQYTYNTYKNTSYENSKQQYQKLNIGKILNNLKIHYPKHITHNVFVTISIIFGLFTAISLLAWLLPNTFDNISQWIIYNTNNEDVMLNAQRIKSNSILYSIIFLVISLFSHWISDRFN